jgi:hypothetical membrane protein
LAVTTRLPRRAAAFAGIVGPISFVALVIVQGILQPDYSHIAMPISALAAWPAGWIQNVNFWLFAAFLASFTVGLHAAIRTTRFGAAGIALLLGSSIGLTWAGLFPWISVNGVPTETPGHVVGAVLSFSCASTGLIVLSRRIGADPKWSDLSTYVLGTGVVMLLLFVALGGFAIAEGAPLHRWAGLLQRVLVGFWLTCLLVMARRLLRVA